MRNAKHTDSKRASKRTTLERRRARAAKYAANGRPMPGRGRA